MSKNTVSWGVIGAGPAGIAAVAHLLKNGVEAKEILWFDPYFHAGDLGRYWQGVTSNTSVAKFHRYFEYYPCFEYENCRQDFSLDGLEEKNTCLLNHPVEVLLSMTQKLKKNLDTIQAMITDLDLAKGYWHIRTEQGDTYAAKQVILAIGAQPKSLSFDSSILPPKEISLYDALQFDKLKNCCQPHQTIAVFGSSHSAILIIKALLEQDVQVFNFFHQPLKYAVDFGDWIFLDNTGLKGEAARFAREVIDGSPPAHLKRYYSDLQNLKTHLPLCDAAIHAVGFEARHNIKINGLSSKYFEYNCHNGIIAPGLFGLGIAYPEKTIDRYFHAELSVGMWKFVDYLSRIFPVWAAYKV
jgi:hypothetical protein